MRRATDNYAGINTLIYYITFVSNFVLAFLENGKESLFFCTFEVASALALQIKSVKYGF